MEFLPYESESEHYKEMQKKFEAKVGDKVYIFKTAERYENGWQNSWVAEMNLAVGHYGIVKGRSDLHGIFVDVPEVAERPLQYPYFVLRIKR